MMSMLQMYTLKFWASVTSEVHTFLCVARRSNSSVNMTWWKQSGKQHEPVTRYHLAYCSTVADSQTLMMEYANTS